MKRSFELKPSNNASEPPTLISHIDGSAKFLRAKTSTQLLSMMNDAVMDEKDDKIAQFISQLKAGEIKTKEKTVFRQRRLTYSDQTTADSSEIVVKPAVQPRAPRTTIFASSEIGVVQEKKPPFPDDYLGTFSCHGIEPSPNEVDGIHEKINQDRGCIVYPYHGSKEKALLMVLDGHGEQGDQVSEFVMRQIVVSLEKDPLLDTDPVEALKSAYITTNNALVVTDIHYMTSGTTCVTIFVHGKRMYVANAGDSRAVIAKRGPSGVITAMDLTTDHKPDAPKERERIEGHGGFVCPPHEEGLSSRVYLDPEFTMIGLAMSRSIGDHAVKNVGVIADPEVRVYDIQDEDLFLVMASDGVWEFIESQEAIEIVDSCLEDGVPVACQELIETAASRWQDVEGDYRDDVIDHQHSTKHSSYLDYLLRILLDSYLDNGNSSQVAATVRAILFQNTESSQRL